MAAAAFAGAGVLCEDEDADGAGEAAFDVDVDELDVADPESGAAMDEILEMLLICIVLLPVLRLTFLESFFGNFLQVFRATSRIPRK